MFKRFIYMLALLVFLCSCKNDSDELPTSETAATRGVEIYQLKQEEVSRVIEGFGNLSFRRKADITSAVDGTIKALPVEEGDCVTENQPIASFYNIQLEIRHDRARADLFSAEAAYELASTRYNEGRLQIESSLLSIEKSELNLQQKLLELEHQRELLNNKRELYRIGGTTEEELSSMELSFSALETEILILEKDIEIKRIGFRDKDIMEYGYTVPSNPAKRLKLLIDLNSLSLQSERKAAEAELKSAETEVRSAEALLSETRMLSPMNGIIGAKYMEVGERIRTDGKLFTIFDSSEVDLIFGVPEEIGVMLEPGQSVDLNLDAVKDRSFSAVIRTISPTIDTKSGNITIKAGLGNEEGLFRPGMFSRFTLTYGLPRNVIRLPANAFLRLDGKRALVLLVKSGRVFPKSIVVEAESGGMHELVTGLEEGDQIILDPSPLLKEGDPVYAR